jgi:uncharacterized protein (TIGR02099 family)
MSRRGVNWLAAARTGLWLVAAAWGVLLVAWLVLQWAILPHVNEWRGQIAHQASRALGVPVRIGHIEVQSHGWVPALRLDDVVLYDAQHREALRLPHVAAAVSAQSLLSLSLRFEQLLIDGAQLEIRRDAQGRIFVAGLQVQGGNGERSEAADWFFRQREFAIRHGSLRWTDEQHNAPPLALADVDVVVRNGLERHLLRLDATPPPDWGDRFSLRGDFRQPLLARAGDWRRWRGVLHADLPRADVRQLRQYLTLPFELSEGHGALRAWVDVDHGQGTGATIDLALADVHLRLQRTLPPLGLQQVSGRVAATRDRQGVSLAVQHFGFTTDDGHVWPAGDARLAWLQRQDRADAPVTGGSFSADRLDLGLMADVAGRLPLGESVRQLLAELAPQGEVQGLSARWDGALDAPSHYQVRARLAGLSIAPGVPVTPTEPARPGWRNAQVDLQASEAGGRAVLKLDHGAVEFPGVFAQAEVPLDRFQADLAWQLTHPGRRGEPVAIALQVQHARFANADAEGEVDAAWHTGPGTGHGAAARFPGVLEMTGRITRGNATSVARYLPLTIPEATRSYVADAVQAGQIDDASFKVQGDLARFPFPNPGEGVFRIAGHVSGVTMAYVPPAPGAPLEWPVFTAIGGELIFDRHTMTIRDAHAQVGAFALSDVQGGIANLAHEPTLTISGQGQGPLADALRYVNASPINGWIGHAFERASAGGTSELKLALAIPLHDSAHSTVRGSVGLQGVDLRLRPDVPTLGAVRGRVDFTQKGFSVRHATLHTLGGDATLDGSLQPDGSVHFEAQGTANADGLRRTSEVPVLARMAASFSGQTPYRLALDIVRGHTQFDFSSPLSGLALDLPAPLHKSADTALPLHVQTQLAGRDEAGAARDTLRVELGRIVQAQYQRDLSGDTPQVLAGAIGVLDTMPTPQPGVAANVNLASLDIDAWRALAQRWTAVAAAAPGTDAQQAAASSGTGAAEEPGGGYVPHLIALRAQELHVDGRRLTSVVAGVSPLPDGQPGWRANVSAQQLNGYVEYDPPTDAGEGRVFARLARLSLPPADAESVENLLDQAPRSVPALDIVIDDFELRGKQLGKVEVQAVNRGQGGTSDWRLAKFDLTVPEARLQGSGQWSPSATGGRRRMRMNFDLQVSDAGALLERLGMPGALRGGAGELQGQIGWAGSPFSLDVPSLDGALKMSLAHGRFLKAGAGAARLLSVLSLQSLPHRLMLDFRDVFEGGFAFDEASGDVQIRDGVASTNNLRMRGVQAAVLMEGEADIGHETQDLRVIVVPEINAGTASLAYAAINPAVGLGTFVAQMFLRKPLMEAATREFHVSGSWDDPKVEQIPHKALAAEQAAPAPTPIPRTPPATAAASAPAAR